MKRTVVILCYSENNSFSYRAFFAPDKSVTLTSKLAFQVLATFSGIYCWKFRFTLTSLSRSVMLYEHRTKLSLESSHFSDALFQCEIERSVGVRVSYRTLRTGEAHSAHSLVRAGRTRACSRTSKWATVRRSARAPCRAPSAETCSPQCEPAVRALTVGLCQHSPPHISGVDRWGFSCWLTAARLSDCCPASVSGFDPCSSDAA